jgi:hypothetical protein
MGEQAQEAAEAGGGDRHVYTIAGYANIRCLSVWRKAESLDSFVADQVPAIMEGGHR